MFTIETLKKIYEAKDAEGKTYIRDDEVVIASEGGNLIYVHPCLNDDENSIEDVEWFIVHSEDVHLCGGDAKKVVDLVNNLDHLVDESNNEKKEIREYFDLHQQIGWTPEDLDWYSDWHKDVFGYRPHGAVCGEYHNPHNPADMATVDKYNLDW